MTKEQIFKFFNVFLASSFIVFGFAIFSLVGLSERFLGELGSFNIIKAASFNLFAGTSEALAVFASAAAVFAAALHSYRIKGTKTLPFLKFKYFLFLSLSLIVLFLTNFPAAWISLIFASGALFAFALYITYANRNNKESIIEINISPALILFLIGILFLFLFSGQGGPDWRKKIISGELPQEAVLDGKSLGNITWESFKNNPLFGSGPATFSYDFSRFRPDSFNSLRLWQLRFDKAPVYIVELLATIGLLGVLSYLIVIGVFFFAVFVFLKNIFRVAPEDCYLAFGFSFAALAVFISQAVCPMSLSLLFIFWFFIALAMVNWRAAYINVFSDAKVNLEDYQELNSIFKGSFLLLLAFFLIFFYWQARYYLADVYYHKYKLGGNSEDLKAAVDLNKNRINYRLSLAKDYLNEARDEVAYLSRPGGDSGLDEKNKQELQINIEKAIKEAKTATELSPNSVAAWETLAVVYREVRLIAISANKWAIEAFNKASALEPSNPVILTELGKSYLADNQTGRAVEALEKAIEKKSDYYEAYSVLAKVYEKLGQEDKALVVLEEAILKSQRPELIYESGRIYYNQGRIEKAIERFQTAVEINPHYANACYSLGLAYEKKGDRVKALEQFRRVLELNPDNEEVRKMIKEIEEE